jgi:hypothetical protein
MKKMKVNWIKGLIAIFDVESVGIHGEGFAVSLLLAKNLKETWHITWACIPNESMGTPEDFKWVKENVRFPPDTIWLGFPQQVRTAFWAKWLELKEERAILCSDVTWPVETSFLSACVKDDPGTRNWQGPYPLVDVNTLHLLGDPPRIRLPEHLPEHDPLADCRHSLRQLKSVITKL